MQRILAAFEKFFAFLMAGKTGQAGKKFADAIAAAAIAVIDFVSNWLLMKLGKGLLKAGKKIAQWVRKKFRGMKAWFKKRNRRKGKKKETKKEKISSKDKIKHERIAGTIIGLLNRPLEKRSKLTFEEFHKEKIKEARKLEKKFQPKLKKPAYLDGGWDLVEVLERDSNNNLKEAKVTIRGGKTVYVHPISKHGKTVEIKDLKRRIENAKKAVISKVEAKVGNYRNTISRTEDSLNKETDQEKREKLQEQLNAMIANRDFLSEGNYDNREWMEQAIKKLNLRGATYTFNASAFTSSSSMRKTIQNAIKKHQKEIDEQLIDQEKNKFSFSYVIPPGEKLYAKGVTFDNRMKSIEVKTFTKIAITLRPLEPDQKNVGRFVIETAYPSNG